MKRRALISVSDKTGILQLAQALIDLDFEILSTGGTADLLQKAGVPVTAVSDVTGFPECLDGRVKTLHPAIHGGLLARRDLPEHMARIAELGIRPIDLVVINLYPFKATVARPEVTLAEAIEQIDIGGPSMLRSAAKNHADVFVLVDPADYAGVLEALKTPGEGDRALRYGLAVKVFQHTAAYDALIAQYLMTAGGLDPWGDKLTLTFEKVQDLRYGENPHQRAAFYRQPLPVAGSIAGGEQLHGKELSYNNIADGDAAMTILREFAAPAVVAVKHANPCGVAQGETVLEAYRKAYDADPVSIFGGIVALNRPVDLATAQELEKTFLEIILAPAFEADALALLQKKRNIRLIRLEAAAFGPTDEGYGFKRVTGGLLVQDINRATYEKLETVTDRTPTEAELKALIFAWNVCKHVKSNAIVLAKDSVTTGIGPGQVNRVGALEIAVGQAGDKAAGSVLASDAFFPFADSIEAAARAGITAIIQPGGAMKDPEVIAAANAHGIAMVFTGTRHFNH